ncbi:hypothetical protein HY489_01985 [Candidatus Woesearchaeota archaeon]|nr:hypothetical protein [Candidatus Woesearchaeota archaeon]
MKKAFVVMLLFALLVACAPAKPAETAQAPTEQEVEQPPAQVEAPPAEPTTETGRKPPAYTPPSEKVTQQTAPTPTPAKEEMNPQLRDLLKRADEKMQSMQFLFGGTDTSNLFLHTYFVKGDKVKIKPYEENYYVRDGYYDTIYLNDGIGCCEQLSRCKSAHVDNTAKKFAADLSAVKMPKTPYQWTKEIKANAAVVGPQTFNQRSVTHIKYTDDEGRDVLMWIDDTYGVPHKIVVKTGESSEIKYQFNDMKFNGLKDSDFVPPCADKPAA